VNILTNFTDLKLTYKPLITLKELEIITIKRSNLLTNQLSYLSGLFSGDFFLDREYAFLVASWWP